MRTDKAAGAAESATTVPDSVSATGERSGRRPRGSISADEIVSAAFVVANKTSVSEFSVPAVAKHLGVGVTSIYWYFRRKEDLLDAMTEVANREYHAATPFLGADDWQDALRRHFWRMRHAFRDQPVLVELTLMRARRANAHSIAMTADKLDTMVATMTQAGFTREDALKVYLSLLAHVCGSAMTEHQGVFGEPTERDGPSAPPAQTSSLLLEALAGKGHHVDGIDDMTYTFTLEAILTRAEQMLRAS